MRPEIEAASLRIGGAWAAKAPTSIAFDLRQEPGAGKRHAGICAGGRGDPVPYRYRIKLGQGLFGVVE
jgi:hypothetical protein